MGVQEDIQSTGRRVVMMHRLGRVLLEREDVKKTAVNPPEGQICIPV